MIGNTDTQAGDWEDVRTIASSAVEAFEAAPMGRAWAEIDAHASASLEALRGTASRALFAFEIEETAPNVIAAFEFIQEAHPHPKFDSLVIDTHARSLKTFPALARFMRSPMVRQRAFVLAVSDAMHRGASASAANDAAAKTVAALELTLSGHLVGMAEFEPAASVLALDVQALSARLTVARQQHEDFARAEAERLTAELQAADRALAEAEETRRRELVLFFGARGGRAFNLANGRVVTGAGLATWVQGGQMHDITDQYVALTTIQELDRLRLETEAAEAATASAV